MDKLKKLKSEIVKINKIKKSLPKFLQLSSVVDGLDEEKESRLEEIEQLKCKHAHTTGMICTGNDSHYNIYENKCEDCGFVLEYDDRR